MSTARRGLAQLVIHRQTVVHRFGGGASLDRHRGGRSGACSPPCSILSYRPAAPAARPLALLSATPVSRRCAGPSGTHQARGCRGYHRCAPPAGTRVPSGPRSSPTRSGAGVSWAGFSVEASPPPSPRRSPAGRPWWPGWCWCRCRHGPPRPASVAVTTCCASLRTRPPCCAPAGSPWPCCRSFASTGHRVTPPVSPRPNGH
jgi:hypothetical protein